MTLLIFVRVMDKATIRDIEVSGKKALIRVGFNVPLDEETGVGGHN